MSKPVKILVVEDSEDDAKLALRVLRRGGFDPTYRRVQTAAELDTALAQERWDAVISDFKMPGFTGMDALGIFRAAGLDIPFILISGTIGEATAVDAMKAGASDYVMKESLARLAPALEREPDVRPPPDSTPMKTACIFADESGRAGTSVPKAGAGGSGEETCEDALTGPEIVGQETSMAPDVPGASNLLPMTSVSMVLWRGWSVTA